jgi:hypothetical protein
MSCEKVEGAGRRPSGNGTYRTLSYKELLLDSYRALAIESERDLRIRYPKRRRWNCGASLRRVELGSVS